MSNGIAPDHVEAGGGSFQGAVRAMFDGIAPGYDRFNRYASLGMDEGWRRAAVRELGASSGRVLDIATGTGDLAFAAERAGAEVVGCDFAAEMIRIAASKATEDCARSAFHVGSAGDLPYAGGSFAGALSAFAMRNVRTILGPVASEMHRVLEPGGKVVILEFTEPSIAPLRWGHHLYTRVLIPRIGGWLTGSREPFDYLNRSIDEWLSPDEFADVLRAAGFDQVGYRLLSFGTVALHWGTRASGSD
ncbi:MAG: ubiquinone/menaquinone biosynthesis methyltransferase [Acidobacteria bacterium]|nr:ubiquinone/menaquinone biosynthesis methyltransferase [Acidobacteriota bacterium]